MSELQGAVGELAFTVTVTKPDGTSQQYDMVGVIDADKLKEIQDGSNAQHGG